MEQGIYWLKLGRSRLTFNDMKRNYHVAITELWSVAMTVLAMSEPAIANAGENDHLEPCQDSYPEYENRLESIVRAAMPGEVDSWVTLFSRHPEWSVGISTDKGRHFVTLVIFQRPLWGQGIVRPGTTESYDFSKSRVRTTVRTARINAGLHAELKFEWGRSIEGVRPLETIPGQVIVRADGETFEFKSLGGCGSAWSPGTETRNGKLVDLVMALTLLASDTGSVFPAAWDNVVRKLNELPPP